MNPNNFKYVREFLELKCAGDVLNSVYPFLNPEKEITESMTIAKKIKKILITNPNKYSLFDLCAGNCLTSSLLAHLYKLNNVVAIDKKDRKEENLRNFAKIKNFNFLTMDIINNKPEILKLIKTFSPSIIVSVHPCSELAIKVIEIYKESESDYLIMIPCCDGKLSKKYPSLLYEKLSKYEIWCLDLVNLCNGNATSVFDCKSEKNIVVFSKREGLNENKK